MKKSYYFIKNENSSVTCKLCPHYCNINKDSLGLCRVRKNLNGTLYSLNYEKTVAINIDPIEKKPLYHFYPNKKTLSIATTSCNFHCQFCQNSEISQYYHAGSKITANDILSICLSNDIKIVSFTYTEPTIWFEFILDTCKILKNYDVKTVLITNGYINENPLKELLKFVDAMNVDVKSFNDKFYRIICGGKLQPVLKTISTAFSQNVHLEITNLIIPNLNDNQSEFGNLIKFISEISTDIPLHISRYFPSYKLKNSPTPISTLIKFLEIAHKKLNYVYLGNINNDLQYSTTICPNCGSTLIIRNNLNAFKNNLIKDRCPNCKRKIYGKFYD